MDGLDIFLIVSLAVFTSQSQISGSVLEVTVTPGDNITLYCDCKLSTGVYILWYRNCSHENQPSLVLKPKVEFSSLKDLTNPFDLLKIFPRFQYVRNVSSESYDLLVMNITDSDEGLYFCGTEEVKVEDKECITARFVYRYGNITTRILVRKEAKPKRKTDSRGCISSPVPVVSWMMVFTPAFTILSSFLSFILVYHFCQKIDKEPQILQIKPDTRGQTRWNQDEDLCLTRVVFQAKDGQMHQ